MMTDHSDLEAELQVSLHVNDQLRARIAELEAALKQSSRIEASLASRIANLMDALEPFADCEVSPAYGDDETFKCLLMVADLRAARAAYLGEKG